MQIYKLPDVEHATKRVMVKLLLVSVVCTVLMIAEVIGGIMAGSLAIMTDAAHLFSDLSGKLKKNSFFLSFFLSYLMESSICTQSIKFYSNFINKKTKMLL